jgi:hypothetical protein
MRVAPGRRDLSKERELSMKRKSLIFGALAVAILGSVLLVGAYSQDPQDPCSPPYISVPGGESRAALEESLADGSWIFTIDKVWGSVSRVEIQIYEHALPTSGTKDPDLFAVCASSPDPYQRTQAKCPKITGVSGTIATAGSLSIKRVKAGAAVTFNDLDAGVYCVRPLAFGKGAVTVSIVHP